MNPYAIPVAITVGLAVYFYGHHAGYVEKETEVQLEIASRNEDARAKEQELNKQINDQTFKLQEANDAITQKQTALDAAIRSGRVRLNASCVQSSSSSTSTGVGGAETASESDRQTLEAIAAIVAQGDRNTEQLNACIDAYNKVMESVNGQR